LYYHRDPVRFRNIWIRDLMPKQDKMATIVPDAPGTLSQPTAERGSVKTVRPAKPPKPPAK
jgi:hypothetical protein